MGTTEVLPYAMTRPTNKIAVRGSPVVTEFKIGVAAGCYPGCLVKKGADANKVVASAAATDNCIGVLGYEQANPNYQPTYASTQTASTTYALDTFAPVLTGPGYIAQLWLADGQTIVVGDYLTASSTAGCVAKADALTYTNAGATNVVCTSSPISIAGGKPATPLIGQAMEDVTTSGAVDKILVKMFI